MYQIMTVTINPAIDKNSSVEHVRSEKKLYCKTPRYEPGGGGVNVSRAINKLGGNSLLLYTAGGLNGQRLNSLLKEENLNEKAVDIHDSTRENLIIFEEATNLQYRFGMPGPKMTDKEYEKIFKILHQIAPFPKYLVISGSLPRGVPEEIYAEMAKLAKKKDCKVVVDVSGQPLKEAMKEGAYLIKPNMGELERLIGKKIKNETVLKTEAKKLVENNCCMIVVVSLGAGGALLVTDKITQFMRPPTVPIKSKVGAGDSMVAGIVLSLARGNSLKRSVLFGLASGSSAVMTPGTELCRKDDTEDLYNRLLKDYNF